MRTRFSSVTVGSPARALYATTSTSGPIVRPTDGAGSVSSVVDASVTGTVPGSSRIAVVVGASVTVGGDVPSHSPSDEPRAARPVGSAANSNEGALRRYRYVDTVLLGVTVARRWERRGSPAGPRAACRDSRRR